VLLDEDVAEFYKLGGQVGGWVEVKSAVLRIDLDTAVGSDIKTSDVFHKFQFLIGVCPRQEDIGDLRTGTGIPSGIFRFGLRGKSVQAQRVEYSHESLTIFIVYPGNQQLLLAVPVDVIGEDF